MKTKPPLNIIKLAVGVQDIAHFYDIQHAHEITYKGSRAVPCWTRYKPKRAEEILETGGSIYRVIKNRIVCRHKILGFEMVDTPEKGTMCAIMQNPEMIETLHMPKCAFQGWRYLKPSDTPRDIGVYTGAAMQDNIPLDLKQDLKAAGLI
ncbi:MAG: DUF1489 family protein [Alphaproteobacteria bacterium]